MTVDVAPAEALTRIAKDRSARLIVVGQCRSS